MRKSKKNLIIISCIVGALIVFAIIFGTLFSLRTVKVDFATTLFRVDAYSKEEIVLEAKLKKGNNIIFENYQDNEDVLEKKFPYAEFNIVRVFPNTAIIYVYERKPIFRVEKNGFWYIFDEDLKCLEILTTSNLNIFGAEDLPVLTLDELEISLQAGDFLSDNSFKNLVKSIIDGVYGFEETPTNILSDIVLSNNDILGNSSITLKIKNTQTTLVIQGEKLIKEKIAYALFVYASDVSQNALYQGKLDKVTITVYKDFDLDNKKIVVNDGSN